MASKRKPKSKAKKARPTAKLKRKPKVIDVDEQASAPPPDPAPSESAYDRHRQRVVVRERSQSEKGREITIDRSTRNKKRFNACRKNLRKFCETYLREDKFWFGWSADHLKAIKKLQDCVLNGGQFAFAMPRGSGKTALAESAALWAILYGHRSFVMFVGPEASAATESLSTIKELLELNDLLAADFPEVCGPVRALEGITQRSKGQTCEGKRTRIQWNPEQIVLPVIEGSLCSGSILRAVGLTGRIRGTKRGAQRPDLAILDDPQTDESAGSANGNRKRSLIISRAVLRLAGPKKKIAAVMPCTVIYPGDMIDKFLDRDKQPQWNGERMKMLYAWPTNMKLWDEYANLRAESLRTKGDGSLATEFYRARQAEMDAGASVAWPEQFNHDELSAIQSAMNLYIDDPKGFAAEAQNTPEKDDELDELRQLVEKDLEVKLNTLARGQVPRDCNRLTAFVDVQDEVLFWSVVGWNDKFGGALVDYGVYPSQTRDVFTAADPTAKLSQEFPKAERGARIYAGLGKLIPWLLGRAFAQQDSETAMSISLCLIDARFETETIHDFIGRSPLKGILKASQGKGILAGRKPMNEYSKEAGDQVGHNWRIDAKSKAKGKYVSFDTNGWKTFIAEAILAAPGSPGAFYLPGKKITEHPLLVVHLLSEHRTATAGYGRKLEEWRVRANNKENHWWDAIVGCAVAASILGVKWSAPGSLGEKAAAAVPRKPVKLNDLMNSKPPIRL